MFSTAINSKRQGEIGEARAIYELTRLGNIVSKPLCDSVKYDLISDDGETLNKIQVKTSSFIRKGRYEVSIATKGGNQTYNTSRVRKDGDYDYLFVMVNDGSCWLIPEDKIGRVSVTVPCKKFEEYRICIG